MVIKFLRNLPKTRKYAIKELKNKKWKHVRDAYLKYMSEESIRSGLEATQKKYR
ncbi:MADF domain-containing protein, partial [Aphis craccivora]